MKKVLLSIMGVGAFLSGALAQQAETFQYGLNQQVLTLGSAQAEKPVNGSQINPKIFQTLVWSDDFDESDIIWTAGSDGQQGEWLFGDNGDLYDTDYYGDMESTTASNGFAFFDGIEFLLEEDVQEQNAWVELTDAINLDTLESVMFTFEQRYRAFNTDQTLVEISLDNGATWEQTVDINENKETNDPSIQDTAFVRFDVNNSSEVKFRFRWENNSTSDTGGSGYAWMVDDVRIYTLPDHDIELVDAPWGTSVVQFFGNVDGMPIDSRIIPEQQISELDFYADLYNLGGEDQTGIEYSIDVNNGDFIQNTNLPLLEEADTATLSLSYTPDGVGTYTVERMIDADDEDENPSNNQFATEEFEVNSNFLYARDDGSDVFSFGIADEVTDFIMFYEIFEPQQLAFVRLGIASDSEPVSFTVTISDFADGNVIASSELIILEPSDLGTEMVIPILDFSGNYLEMQPGIYRVGTETGEPNMRLSGGGSINPATAVFEVKSGPNAGAFGSFSNAPRIRLDFDPTVSVDENEINNHALSLFPNPAKESANLTFELNNESNVAISVVDVTGQVVYSEDYGSLNSGKQQLKLNTAEFNSGVYFVNLSTEGAMTTKRLIINK